MNKIPSALIAAALHVAPKNDVRFSYGPRQEFDGSVEPCAPMAAQFWGVYRWAGKDRWWWIADVADEDTARAVAAAYLLNVKPDWAH